jgi:hypothetical protein
VETKFIAVDFPSVHAKTRCVQTAMIFFNQLCTKARDMKNCTGLLVAIFLCGAAQAQKGYTQYQKVNGLEISTKWGKAKDADGVKKDALLLKVENTEDKAVTLDFDINFYYEGMLRESGRIEGECIPGLKSRVGKLNGIYFVPENFTSEQLENSNFNFTLDEIEVEEVDECLED